MGVPKDKYTRGYFLKQNEDGTPRWAGAEGVEEYWAGSIRSQDRDILERVVFAGLNVLDIGFGRGEAMKYVLDHAAARVTGIDFSPEAAALARDLLDRSGLNAEIHVGDAIDVLQVLADRPPCLFDIVILLDVIEHIPRQECRRLLEVLRPLLSSTAVLLINTPVYAVDNDVIAEGLKEKARDTSDEHPDTAGMHCNRYTARSLRRFLSAAGFCAVSGHVFLSGASGIPALRARKGRWRSAIRQGYPLRPGAENRPECFERAMTLSGRHRRGRTMRVAASSAYRFLRRAAARAVRSARALAVSDSNTGLPTEPRRWTEAGPADIGRFRMFLDPESDGHGARQMAEGTYDDVLFRAAQSIVPLGGAVVWDVGAHIGYESLCFAVLVGDAGTVVAFEPNPANTREWERNVGGNPQLAGRMMLKRMALSCESGKAAFRFSEDVVSGRSSGSHLADVMPPEDPACYSTFGVLDVTCARADDLVTSGVLRPPALVKIDVEGAEADVLRGATATLRTHRPLLLLEVHHVRAMHEVDDVLRAAGYSVSLLDSPEESPSRCFVKAIPIEASV
jgi:FkbM family methyltransferase